MRSKSFCMILSVRRRLTFVICATICLGACSGPGNSSTDIDDSIGANVSAPQLTYGVTVSGVSSGAYMAVQTHIALADRIDGVAAIAGGPYHCAQGSVTTALGACISGNDIDINPLLLFTRQAASDGQIAATEDLRDAKAWIFHGAKDSVVGSGASEALADFYREFVPSENVTLVDDIGAAHGWPTQNYGNECSVMGGDFINACDFAAAGALLNYLYDDLKPRESSIAADGLQSIDLSAHVEPGSGLADTGFIYLPHNCRDSSVDCRLHIAFHGCRQGVEFIENRFAANVGLNEWATNNHIIVLYPQVKSSVMNPQGCWDWWGYTGPNYDNKNGKQISTIAILITAWAEGKLY